MVMVVSLVALAGCGHSTLTPSRHGKTVWLCVPGHDPDPCTPGLSTTVYSPTLREVRVEHPHGVEHPSVDCFYVYPTVSAQTTGNADLRIEASEREAALSQVARYSQYCRVFVPMYRQVTLAGLFGTSTTKPSPALALADLRQAFADYLGTYNHGRGFVLIGHSQGAYMLRQLIAKDVDPTPAVRRQLVSAILLGGNVLVRRGRDVGGDFKYISACHTATQLHCVIAFSTFDQPVPALSRFGRPASLLGTEALPGSVVLCTNPAALAGGSGLLDPIFPGGRISALGSLNTPARTVWSTAPGSYTAHCASANNAHVLQIKPMNGAHAPAELPDPTWGLHLVDANIAQGNLVEIVRREAAAFTAEARGRASAP